MLTDEQWDEIDDMIIDEIRSVIHILAAGTFILGIVAGIILHKLYIFLM